MKKPSMKVHNTTGFSLVELVIIMVILGILAAVVVPIYHNEATKKRINEADATLASIRSQLQVYYGENGKYPTAEEPVIGASWNRIKAGDLTGSYFSDSSFTYASADGALYTITCARGDILKTDRTLSHSGKFGGGNE